MRKIAALFVMCLLIAPMPLIAATARVSWNQPEVSIAVEVGGERYVGVSITSDQDLVDVQLRVVPELAGLVSPDPTQIALARRGESTPVWLRVSIPDSVQPGLYQGTVHVRQGAATVAVPLRMKLTVLSAASISDPNGSGQPITVSTDSGKLEAMTVLPSSSVARPPGVTLPFGLLGFRVTGIAAGAQVRVTVKYPVNTLGLSLFKYVNGHWLDISDRAAIGRSAVVYTIVDGGDLDADGVADGIVVDPVAVAVSSTTYSDACNPLRQYESYADQLGSTYKVPPEIIKEVMLHESGWRQFRCDSTGQRTALMSGDGGVGLMQVTCGGDQCFIGNVSSAPSTLTLTSELKQKLKDDWKFNMEIGVRILLAKKYFSDSTSGPKNPAVLENWYYPLANYNGYIQWRPELVDYCSSPGPYNDPRAPCYSRRSLASIDDRTVFPYQEIIFGHLAGYSKASIAAVSQTLKDLLPPDIKVTLPGPSSVCSGAGKFKYLVGDFRGNDVAIFEAPAIAASCGLANAVSDMLCEPSRGASGSMTYERDRARSSLPACVHTQLPAPSSTTTAAAVGRVFQIFDSNSLLSNILPQGVAIGDPVSFSVTYPPGIPDSTPNDPTLGQYFGGIATGTRVTATIGTNTPIVRPTTSSQQTYFVVALAKTTFGGFYNFQANEICAGICIHSIQLQLGERAPGTAITSDALPQTFPPRSLFTSEAPVGGTAQSLILLWVTGPGGTSSTVWATVDSVSVQ